MYNLQYGVELFTLSLKQFLFLQTHEEHVHDHHKGHEHKEHKHDHECEHKDHHDHGHHHEHEHPKHEEAPAWKKKAMEKGNDPHAAPFGGEWHSESNVSASDKMDE